MAEVSIRAATTDDHGAVAAILRVGYDGFQPGTPYLRWVLDPAEWAPQATATLVADDDDDRVVGVVAFALADTPLHEPVVPPMGDAGFRFLSVATDARGRGVGAALVQACVDRARAAGCARLGIFSMAFMTDAHRLYERLGFQRRPDLDVHFPGGVGLALTMDLVDDAARAFAAPGPVPDPLPWYEDVFEPPADSPTDDPGA